MQDWQKKGPFRTELGYNTFKRYATQPGDTFRQKCKEIVLDVTGVGVNNRYRKNILTIQEQDLLYAYLNEMMLVPGGRYWYYAGRTAQFFINCYLLRGERDTREEWARLLHDATSCLMTGGGIGADYSVFRARGTKLARTGGEASGPIPLMRGVDSVGAQVKQGGGRRSAIYASLHHSHADIPEFLRVKDWDNQQVGTSGLTVGDLKRHDFSYQAPFECTNISVNYDEDYDFGDPRFLEHVELAMRNGEPGFSFNFGPRRNETLRNACTEITSQWDGDSCNLGHVNLGQFTLKDYSGLPAVAQMLGKFLVCGTLRSDVPYDKIYTVRSIVRRIGAGIMGVHEMLLRSGQHYGYSPELGYVMQTFSENVRAGAQELCDRLGINAPLYYTAIAPTGTTGTMVGTTTGIEPLYAVAYIRRWFKGTDIQATYQVDAVAEELINRYNINPESIETASELAKDPERRMKFQVELQRYIDQGISSTLNLPAWGTQYNNESTVQKMADLIKKHGPDLRGMTFYPDGARGGQPITAISYEEAVKNKGVTRVDTSEFACKEGVCAV